MEQANNRPLEIEVLNSIKGTYIVRFDFIEKFIENEEISNTSFWEFQEKIFEYKPSIDELKSLITDYYNKCCDVEILSGFVYDETPIWLSQENQFNYKASFDLAKQTNGSNLPVKFKFGSDIEPKYKSFETIEYLEDFYLKMNLFTNNTLNKYWELKDSIDWELYTII